MPSTSQNDEGGDNPVWRTYRGAREGSGFCAWVGFVAVWFGSFLEVNVRPTWDAYFLDIAAVVASRSPCVKRQVGAVLVSEDRAILATGYNGPPRGAPHRDETTCVRIGTPSGEGARAGGAGGPPACAHRATPPGRGRGREDRGEPAWGGEPPYQRTFGMICAG